MPLDKKMKIGLSENEKISMKEDIYNRVSIKVDKVLNEQSETIAGLGQLRPSGVDARENILNFTSDKGIYIGSDDGHWYYWDEKIPKYVDGGIYQTTAPRDVLEKGVNVMDNKKLVVKSAGDNGGITLKGSRIRLGFCNENSQPDSSSFDGLNIDLQDNEFSVRKSNENKDRVLKASSSLIELNVPTRVRGRLNVDNGLELKGDKIDSQVTKRVEFKVKSSDGLSTLSEIDLSENGVLINGKATIHNDNVNFKVGDYSDSEIPYYLLLEKNGDDLLRVNQEGKLEVGPDHDEIVTTSSISSKLDKKDNVSENPQVYVKSENGNQTMVNISSTPQVGAVVSFDNSGNINSNLPTRNNHIANKKYVDDEIIALENAKLSKITAVSNNDRVYYVDKNGVNGMLNVSTETGGNSLAKRDSKGHVSTSDPENDTHSANKRYVDNKVKNIPFSVTMSEENYVVTFDLNGTIQTIDLPLESVVVNASYENGSIILTLKNGNELNIPLGDLTQGLSTTQYVDEKIEEVKENVNTMIDVEKLPEENINENAIYRVTKKYINVGNGNGLLGKARLIPNNDYMDFLKENGLMTDKYYYYYNETEYNSKLYYDESGVNSDGSVDYDYNYEYMQGDKVYTYNEWVELDRSEWDYEDWAVFIPYNGIEIKGAELFSYSSNKWTKVAVGDDLDRINSNLNLKVSSQLINDSGWQKTQQDIRSDSDRITLRSSTSENDYDIGIVSWFDELNLKGKYGMAYQRNWVGKYGSYNQLSTNPNPYASVDYLSGASQGTQIMRTYNQSSESSVFEIISNYMRVVNVSTQQYEQKQSQLLIGADGVSLTGDKMLFNKKQVATQEWVENLINGALESEY